MSKHKNGVLRCVVGGKLYEIEVPYPVNTGGFDRWRREIVLAGPLDMPIIRAVQLLEQQDGVEVIWRGPGGPVCTSGLEVRFRKWAAKKGGRPKREQRRARRAG